VVLAMTIVVVPVVSVPAVLVPVAMETSVMAHWWAVASMTPGVGA
jgi:hypothetical protein